MIPPFNEALADLLEKYSHHDLEELIGDMERAIEGLSDDLAHQKLERRREDAGERD